MENNQYKHILKNKNSNNTCYNKTGSGTRYFGSVCIACTIIGVPWKTIPLLLQWNLSKPNTFQTKTFAQNRQVFSLDRLNSLKLGLNLMFSLHRISIYSGFSLDRFHCIIILIVRFRVAHLLCFSSFYISVLLFLLFVFVMYLVPNVSCVSGLSILDSVVNILLRLLIWLLFYFLAALLQSKLAMS